MKRVILESPYKGQRVRNLAYAEECIADCLKRGESPLAGHLCFTLFLDDNKPHERALGIQATLAWGECAEAFVVYEDFGITEGMQQGIDFAECNLIPVERRQLYSKEKTWWTS